MQAELFRFTLKGTGMRRPEYHNPRYRAALEEQERLKGLLESASLPANVRLVAGADCSFNRFGSTFWGALVVCDAEDAFRIVDSAVVCKEVDFPYLPGLLGFREVPVLAAAFAALKTKPEVTLVDAHGTSHPRRFGSAAHLGVVSNIPTVGCAKSLLCGTFKEPGNPRGSWSPLMDDDECIGAVLRARAGVAPVFVSSGHRCDLESALALVLRCSPRYRVPEPIRLAHELVNRARKEGMVIE